uniref:Uncharacterized protein n=1 Tax=uncultured prokaryote TaxID=198431 RepID=A0A0H5Q6N8_9ZZZZ|nr:hypothetical protein [uncultured prokaryote]
MQQIHGGTLTIYDSNYDDIKVDLSNTQLAFIVKVLGIEFIDDKTVTCFSDKQLYDFLEKNINPLRLMEVKEEK